MGQLISAIRGKDIAQVYIDFESQHCHTAADDDVIRQPLRPIQLSHAALSLPHATSARPLTVVLRLPVPRSLLHLRCAADVSAELTIYTRVQEVLAQRAGWCCSCWRTTRVVRIWRGKR